MGPTTRTSGQREVVSSLDQLQHLASLRDLGLISEGEFREQFKTSIGF